MSPPVLVSGLRAAAVRNGLAIIVGGVCGPFCLIILALSSRPGALNDSIFPLLLLAVVAVPVLAIAAAAAVTLVVLFWKGKLRLVWQCRWAAVVCATLLSTTWLALRQDWPLRIAFSRSRSAFDAAVAGSPQVDDVSDSNFDRRVGSYTVDARAADRRGGVFFRTHRGVDGLGPDVMSYGFAFHPNPDGTPFGAAGYQRSELGGGWYWFCASDDWR